VGGGGGGGGGGANRRQSVLWVGPQPKRAVEHKGEITMSIWEASVQEINIDGREKEEKETVPQKWNPSAFRNGNRATGV